MHRTRHASRELSDSNLGGLDREGGMETTRDELRMKNSKWRRLCRDKLRTERLLVPRSVFLSPPPCGAAGAASCKTVFSLTGIGVAVR
jgi:hypothetical protein